MVVRKDPGITLMNPKSIAVREETNHLPALAFSSEHQVPRCRLRDPVSYPVLAFPNSRGLSQLDHSRSLAPSIRTEPDGRSRRRLSLGVARSAGTGLGSASGCDSGCAGAPY